MSSFKTNKRALLRVSKPTYQIYFNKCCKTGSKFGLFATHCNEKFRISKRSAIATYKRLIRSLSESSCYEYLRKKYYVSVFLVSPAGEIMDYREIYRIKSGV